MLWNPARLKPCLPRLRARFERGRAEAVSPVVPRPVASDLALFGALAALLLPILAPDEAQAQLDLTARVGGTVASGTTPPQQTADTTTYGSYAATARYGSLSANAAYSIDGGGSEDRADDVGALQ